MIRHRVLQVLSLVVVIGAGVALAACGSDAATPATTRAPAPTTSAAASNTAPGVTVVTPQQGKDLLAANHAIVLIDVRTAAEFAAGHIAGAINIDLEGGQFTALIAPLDHAVTYMVYCHSGRRATIAASTMHDAGFTTIYNLGGVQQWTAAGLPLVPA